jgi:hypothetical protein
MKAGQLSVPSPLAGEGVPRIRNQRPETRYLSNSRGSAGPHLSLVYEQTLVYAAACFFGGKRP